MYGCLEVNGTEKSTVVIGTRWHAEMIFAEPFLIDPSLAVYSSVHLTNEAVTWGIWSHEIKCKFQVTLKINKRW